MKSIWLFLVLIPIIEICFAFQLKQERATVDYCNANYLSECYCITRRTRRGGSYKTNMTVTTKYPSGNNVTMRISLLDTVIVDLVNVKLCEISKIDWLYDFFQTHSNMTGNCPFQPQKYSFFDIELPPKNFPQSLLPLLKGNFKGKLYFQATKTAELLAEGTIILHGK